MKEPHNFRKTSASAVADRVLGAAVAKTADILYSVRAAAVSGYPGFEELRDWGRSRKMEVSGDLAGYARRFSDRLEAAGGVAHFARDAREAVEIVTSIARGLDAGAAVKSKSMTAEEISLNEALLDAGVTVTETDLGEFIIQLAGEKPSHIVAPAIHRNRAQVAELFHEALGSEPGLDVADLVRVARKALRERFLAADIGITGANFAVAETGTIAIVTNEGNGRLTSALPPVQIAIAGIDKVIPKLSDLPGFLKLLIRSATGQIVSSYVTVITGPRRQGEEEGPRELHVVLLDNGRSSLASGRFREMLHCLHCGACLNSCPVYRAVGGHAYESVYPGPMGNVLSPLLWGMEAYADLPDACTLCGRCAETCPMRIPLPEYHRKLRVVRAGLKGGAWKAQAPAMLAQHPPLYRAGLRLMRRALLHQKGLMAGPAGAWTICRELPRPQQGPDFRSWWENRKKGSPVNTPEILQRYIRMARAAGTLVECVTEADLPTRLAALLSELAQSCASGPDRICALSALGWPKGLQSSVESILASAGFGLVKPEKGQGGYSWDIDRLAAASVGIIWCEHYLADTGSLVLSTGPGKGGLASLLPEISIVLSDAQGCLEDLSDYLRRLDGTPPSRITLATGPSRTGDIEATMTTGVHGPGKVVHFILCENP